MGVSVSVGGNMCELSPQEVELAPLMKVTWSVSDILSTKFNLILNFILITRHKILSGVKNMNRISYKIL